MGRFAKRFSGERPVSLGFELTFLSEFSEFVWRVLDRDAKRRACISQAPAKVPFEVLIKNFHLDEQRIACYYSRFRI